MAACGLAVVRQEADPGYVLHPAAHLAGVEVVAGDPEPGAGQEHVVRAYTTVAAVIARAVVRGDVQVACDRVESGHARRVVAARTEGVAIVGVAGEPLVAGDVDRL